MSYTIIISKEADEDARLLKKSEISAYEKLLQLFDELQEHPRRGTGKPKVLKYGKFKGMWSRRITQKHRLIYEIREEKITVLVLAASGHYDDK